METLNTLLLTRLTRFHLAELAELYKRAGSATAVMEHRNDIRDILPDASRQLVEALKDADSVRPRAEKELEYDQQHHIQPICMNDRRYPQRLKECADAPLLLYHLGNADLNCRHTLNIIGTRHCTTYGQDIIRTFVRELKTICPDVLIFSGLAYGVDIHAHREALANGFSTVGVLAHGLDDLYPRGHRETAAEMVRQGGLLTEYMTHTQPVARNFVQRNRIVAGCSDATILIESAAKGGGLITCNIARSYGREVFAFPGAIGAEYSEGCNNLIRDNGAALITSATDFVKAMGWDEDKKLEQAQKKGIERTLFPDLSAEEETVVKALGKNNDLQINLLSVQANIPIARLTGVLFGLEMKGVVRAMAGGCYHLLG
ncbi:MAG: DNA-processing protein DprA [Prevotella sp.]|nr:DNA-processing protein DprA [Prevotella sp.]